MPESNLPRQTWDRKEIQQAAFSWGAVADSGVLTETDPGQQRMAEGYRDALNMVLRNIPRFTTVSEMGVWYAHRNHRQITVEEAELITAIANTFYLYPKEVPS